MDTLGLCRRPRHEHLFQHLQQLFYLSLQRGASRYHLRRLLSTGLHHQRLSPPRHCLAERQQVGGVSAMALQLVALPAQAQYRSAVADGHRACVDHGWEYEAAAAAVEESAWG